MTLTLVPLTVKAARPFIGRHHRHNLPPVGGLFATSVVGDDGTLHGVGVAARPMARALDDGVTVEVTRVCTDCTPHVCSMLYGALWRAAKALGYRRGYTYTLASESGACLRAAGWRIDAELAERGGWDNGRVRVERDLFGDERTPTGPKLRWVKP